MSKAPGHAKTRHFYKPPPQATPVAHGSKEVPDGAPDCLAGLSFVFTGELSSFSREEATDVAKRFGGYVQVCLTLSC